MKRENNPELVRFGEPLPIEVETFLRTTNRWWEGKPPPPPPPFRRWMFEPALKRLKVALPLSSLLLMR